MRAVRRAIGIERLVVEGVLLVPVRPVGQERGIAFVEAEEALDERDRHGARIGLGQVDRALRIVEDGGGGGRDEVAHLRQRLIVEDRPHHALFAPVIGGIVLRHEVAALLGRVEIDAELAKAVIDLRDIDVPGQERQLRQRQHRPFGAQLGEERRAFLVHEGADQRPARLGRGGVDAIEIGAHP